MPDDPWPTFKYVLWAHRLLLGREPEDPEVVEAYPETTPVTDSFISFPEFRANSLKHVHPPRRHHMVEPR